MCSGGEISRQRHFSLQETQGDHGIQEGEAVSGFSVFAPILPSFIYFISFIPSHILKSPSPTAPGPFRRREGYTSGGILCGSVLHREPLPDQRCPAERRRSERWLRSSDFSALFLPTGRKFDLRIYVLVTSVGPKTFESQSPMKSNSPIFCDLPCFFFPSSSFH